MSVMSIHKLALLGYNTPGMFLSKHNLKRGKNKFENHRYDDTSENYSGDRLLSMTRCLVGSLAPRIISQVL